MGQVLHGSATTTEAVRRAIQDSQASLRELAGRFGINPKTVAKWRRRISVSDARMGLLHGRRTQELEFAQGRGPDPATMDHIKGGFVLEDDPLR